MLEFTGDTSMKSFSHYLLEQEGLPDVSHYKQVGGQLGSNKGGVFNDPLTNTKHYLKFYRDPDQARSEVAAANVYEKVGAKTLKPRLVSHEGKTAVATSWRDDLKPLSHSDYTNLQDHEKHSLSKHFHAAVLTKNWDTVGMGLDNISKDKHGEFHTLDTGGSFSFRAQGGHKDYDHKIGEYDSLRDRNMNPDAHHVFSKLDHDHLKSGQDHAVSLSDHDAHNIISDAGLPKDHAHALIARRDALSKK